MKDMCYADITNIGEVTFTYLRSYEWKIVDIIPLPSYTYLKLQFKGGKNCILPAKLKRKHLLYK